MFEAAETVIVFVVGLLIGAFGIYVGGRAVSRTAPGLPRLPGRHQLAVLRRLGDVAMRTLVAWIIVAAVLYALTLLDVTSPDPIGVPLA